MMPTAAVEQQSERGALEDDVGAVGHAHSLEEQDDLEALSVDRGEAQQSQADQGAAHHHLAGGLDSALPPPVVMRNPPGPVDAVEEPVHHEQ